MRIKISIAGRRRSRQGGFTYVMVLAAIAVIAIVIEAAGVMTSHTVRADRERELLFRGLAYRNAVKSYYEADPIRKTYPRELKDLLRDPRFPNRRHLRALYADPMARDEKKEWRLIRAPDGGIAGVVSSSSEEPRKQANFPKDLEKFSGAKSYSEWLFEFVPKAVTPSPVVPPKSARATEPPHIKLQLSN